MLRMVIELNFSYWKLFRAYIAREDEGKTLNNSVLEIWVFAMHKVTIKDGCLNPLIIV
jgi:hypothetical protein